MKEYDVIIVGSGAGLDILEAAVEHGLKTALIDDGPAGGTCLNVGCIPSKMLIFPADRVMDVREAASLGIDAEIKGIDFAAIMDRSRRLVEADHREIEDQLRKSRALDFYQDIAEFVDRNTFRVGNRMIKANLIYLASGSRPLIPSIPGLDQVDYLTNESLLQLRELPKSLIIIGGGYVGVEYAHFFQAMGSDVTLLEMGPRLVPSEEPEISDLLLSSLSRRFAVLTGSVAESVEETDSGRVAVRVSTRHIDNRSEKITAAKLLIAAGRRSNADRLKVENAGIKTDSKGYIKVNAHLETNVKGIYAIGDANGREMFTHTSHAEAAVAAANGIHGQKKTINYWAAPHAVFTHPQIASVGLTEHLARQKYKISVGRTAYADIALGVAMMQQEGFAKIILEQETRKILGGHVIGPWASVVIQEVVNVMARRGGVADIGRGIHIHPALSELIIKAVYNAV
ncbi:dihydrolipoyl dehydrogenase [Dehalogenimonas sp. 4OHTPN]|uniref:Dihydrolipoyl dehydrogenase n=1 Tax=Dehalogenimonas sp. 4OHTPN TaxID=3166643 RepID=A0AAU8G720_9CHLR